MKRFIFFACVCAAVGNVIPFAAAGQDPDPDPYPNYVVIGAFANHKNAVRFTQEANQNKFPAHFEMNYNRNLYYVFVLTTDDREYAIAEALKLRTDTKYFDTWVFSGSFGQAGLATLDSDAQDFDPTTGQKINSIHTLRENSAGRIEQEAVGGAQRKVAGKTGNVEQETTTSLRDGQNAAIGRDRTGNTQVRPQETSDQSRSSNENKPGESVQKTNNITGRQESGQGLQGNGQTRVAGKTGNVEQKTTTSLGDGQNAAVEGDRARSTQEGGEDVQRDEINTASQTNQQQALTPSNEKGVEGQENLTRVNGPPFSSTGNVGDPTAPPRELPVRANDKPLTPEEVVGKNFFFQLLRADNHQWVEGEVDAIDFEKARRMATYQANTPVKVILPSGKSKRISFVCQVFGYRKQQIEFDPAEPSPDFFLDKKGNLIVPFELVRLQKGDIAIMYNVFFFKDAALMRPESRYEVNNLLDLLKENPSYDIKIHGHTNGNASGKIIRIGEGKNFYSLSDTKEGFGSAKKLSEERAAVIKQFLVSSGISEERMQVKAWGGKKPIHDKNSVRAIENVRVEIEILSD